MAEQRLITRAVGDFVRSFVVEGGEFYRREYQDFDATMERVKLLSDAQAAGKRTETDRRYVGSVPITLIADWCRKNGYTLDQWARNDGGIPGLMYPESKSGVKDKFMKYFLSREFSKLHTQHVTTKRESSVFVVPERGVGNADLGRTENGGS